MFPYESIGWEEYRIRKSRDINVMNQRVGAFFGDVGFFCGEG